jgi:hypothetical protein
MHDEALQRRVEVGERERARPRAQARALGLRLGSK